MMRILHKQFLELECQNKDRYSYVQPQGRVTVLQHREEFFGIVIVEWFVRYLMKVHLDLKVVEEGELVDSTGAGASSTGTGEATLARGEKNSSNTG
ncbi:hypothetical protein Tco_0102592 [Tanacetum coccineum]